MAKKFNIGDRVWVKAPLYDYYNVLLESTVGEIIGYKPRPNDPTFMPGLWGYDVLIIDEDGNSVTWVNLKAKNLQHLYPL